MKATHIARLDDAIDPEKLLQRLESFLNTTRLAYRFKHLGHDTHTMSFWAADDVAANLVSKSIIPLIKR